MYTRPVDLIFAVTEYSPKARSGSADAQILNGNARLSIARGVALRVHCETVNGKITNSLDTTVELNEQSSRKIDLSLGTGRRSDLTVRVTSGDITIVAAEPGG